jgi:plastocyanin
MKNKSNLLLLSFVVMGVIVAAGVVAVGGKMLTGHSEASTTCATTGKTIAVKIKDDVMSPRVLTVHRCDKMTITNLDPTTREIGFGEHDHHSSYDGISEKVIRQNESFTITFNKTGTFHFHDHFHDEVEGQFTVY